MPRDSSGLVSSLRQFFQMNLMPIKPFIVSGTPYVLKKGRSASVLFSLVIPSYNESKNIHELIVRVTAALDKVVPSNYELIIVDDDSPDGTWKIATALMKDYPSLRVYRRKKGRGLAAAVIRGWQRSRGSILGVIDADLQHPPEVLESMLKTMMEKDADLVVGSRYVKQGGAEAWNIFRRLISLGAKDIARRILPHTAGRVKDPLSGFFLVKRRCISGVLFRPLGYRTLLEVLGRTNLRTIEEVGYVFLGRKKGLSKMTWKICLEDLIHIVRLREKKSSCP